MCIFEKNGPAARRLLPLWTALKIMGGLVLLLFVPALLIIWIILGV